MKIPDDLAACHTGRPAANYGVTIDLKKLTADSLEIFGQVSPSVAKSLDLVEQQSSQSQLKRKGAVDVREMTPFKRSKILPLAKLSMGVGQPCRPCCGMTMPNSKKRLRGWEL